MKQVLKRFVTLALILALVAAISPAILPTASAAEVVLESASEGITGLTVSYDGGSWQANTYGYIGGTMTVAAEGCGGATVYQPIPSKLTLKNDTSQPANLSFDYLVELNAGTITINGNNITGDGSYAISLNPWQSIDIDVLSCDFEENRTGLQLYNIEFSVEEDVNVTFSVPQYGTYTVDGSPLTEETTITKSFGESFHVVASAQPGYTFLGWFNDLDFTCLSADATADLLITCDCVVYPYFFNEGTLQFKVGTETFTDLNAADSYASSHGHDPIILLSDGELPAGTYTISKGNTLLIPCSGEFELVTTDPEAVNQIPNFSNTSAFRTLTLGPGATLNVNGAVSLAAKQNMSMPCLGATTGGYGYIQLSQNSNITVNNGGKLYVWGYITGSGTVTVKKGGTVYEPFQIMDFRGGTASMAMMNAPAGVFPFSQYYIQNVESRMTLEFCSSLATSPATVPFIDQAGANAMFLMENGCTFTKYYNAAEDRVCFEVNGDCSINSISLTIVGGEDGLTINSSDYMLPLNGDFHIEVESGTLTCNQDMYVQPGAEIIIGEDAEMVVPYIEDPENPENSHAVTVIIYDSEDWGGYCGPNDQTICPIRYTPSGPDNIRDVPADASDLPDAFVDVNGQITIAGEVYTTEHGACVTSTEGTGKIMFENDAPSSATTYQTTQDGTNPTNEGITMTSIQLNDGNGNYTSTEGVTTDTPFNFSSTGGWIDAPDYDITYSVMGTATGSENGVNSVLGTTLPTSVNNAPNGGWTFAGWSESQLLGSENTSAEILTGEYAPSGDVTLYAVFKYTVNDFVKLDTMPTGGLNGKYLIVSESASVAFNSAVGTTQAQINANNNVIDVTIDNGVIAYTQERDNAAVEIHPHGADGAYTMQAHNNSYLGHSGGSGTGFNVNAKTEYENTITIENGVATITNVPTTGGSRTAPLKYRASTATTTYNKFAYYLDTASGYYMPALYRMGTDYYTTKLTCECQEYTSVVTAPGCLTGGYTTNTCTNCGRVWTTNPTDPVGHLYSFEIIEPTEDDQGYTTYTCSVCGDTYDGDYTDPLGHAWTVNFYAKDPNSNDYTLVSSGEYNSLHGTGLPATAPEAAGYTFRGWSEVQYADEVASATVLSGYYVPPRDNMNLYAIYTRSSAAQATSNGDYIKVANGDQIKNGGKYLFVCEGNNFNVSQAFNTGGDRIDEGNTTSVTIDATGDRNRIAATQTLDDGAVTINYAFGSGAYYIFVADGRYMGNTGSGSGFNLNAHTDYKNRISVDESGYCRVANVSDKAEYTLRYQGKFNYYKATNGTPQSISLYYKDGTGDQLFYTTRPIPCDHHNATYVTTPATCTTDGYYTWTCPDCNATWVEPGAYALGHEYDDGHITQPSAANGWIGYTTYECQRCGDTYQADFVGVDFTVRYSVLGTLSEPLTVNSYYGTTLPSAADEVFGYEFVGWSPVTIDPEHEVAETEKGGTTYHPTANVTLYATYARYVDSDMSERDYVRISQNSNFASGGKVLIVCETHDGGAIVFNGNADPIFGSGNFKYVTIDDRGTSDKADDVIEAKNSLTECEIAVKPIAGTHYFTMQIRNNKYIGSTGSSTGINQNNRPNYRTSMTIDAYNNAIIANVGGKNTYHFGYNSGSASDRFGFYNPNGNTYESVALYFKEGTEFKMYYTTNPDTHVHEYELYDETPATCTTAGEQTYYCLCGDNYTVTVAPLGHDLVFSGYNPVATCTTAGAAIYNCSRCSYSESTPIPATGHLDEDFDAFCDECFEPMPRFESAALSLDEDFDVVYKALLPDGFNSASVTFTLGNDTPVTVSTYTDNGDGTYSFVFEGINPQRMGDNISATLTVNADNAGGEPTTYTDTQATYSVKQYCLNKLADETISDSLRKLLSDTLAYGAAAQTYMNYNTNAPVTSGADNPTYSTFSNLSGLGASFEGTADANTYWLSAGLTLQNNVAMTFRFYAASTANLTVTVSINGRSKTFNAADFVSVGNNVYAVSFNGIKAEEFANTVTASFAKNGAALGNTLRYSVNAYVQAKQSDSDTNLANLVKALYNYGASAAAYTD